MSEQISQYEPEESRSWDEQLGQYNQYQESLVKEHALHDQLVELGGPHCLYNEMAILRW
jgi:hypothetical protein